jgi:outer membrane scaffolding protein for murein synthesis (MipA/OmpV family)
MKGRRSTDAAVAALLALGAALAQAQALAQASTPAAPAAAPPDIDDRAAPPPGALKPLWELGLGAAGLTFPHYRGAAERSSYLLPLPYVVYRGKFLRSDRDGARAVFLETGRTEVDLSIGGSAPARSKADGVRAGMANLPPTFEIGPNLNVTLWRDGTGGRGSDDPHLDLRLPVRAAVTLQRSPRAIGWVFTPNLNLDLPGRLPLPGGRWNVGLATGPVFASRRYHQHYYGVAPAEAVATPELQRPAYDARGGYGGWNFTAAVSRRFERVWAGAFVRYDTLSGAVFEDSPLVRRRNSLYAGFGISYVFAESDTQVDTRPGQAQRRVAAAAEAVPATAAMGMAWRE